MRSQRPIYSLAEVALAAGVHVRVLRDLAASGRIETIDGRFLTAQQALAAGRRVAGFGARLRRGRRLAERPLLSLVVPGRRTTGMPIAMSSLAHAAVITALVLVTSGSANTFTTHDVDIAPEPLRLVYLATPGPGGGGGGGGRREPEPPPKAEREGPSPVSSPVPAPESPAPVEPEPDPPPPPPDPPEEEPIVAPVATVEGDEADRAGVLEERPVDSESRGAGEGGGTGDGRGSGIGEGDGSGIGPGSGGGTGGGPFRPGSGIEPPRLLHEVKPDYTEAARRAGVQGEVVLEIVVRADGRVGAVRVVQSLSPGLDRRAVDAVRRWRFEPATRFGQPVDVFVEVAVEFQQR